MNSELKRKLIKGFTSTGLVCASLFIAFVVIQISGLFFLKNQILMRYAASTPKMKEDIWTFEDVEKLSRTNSRSGEISRVILAMDLQKKVALPRTVRHDDPLKMEPTDFSTTLSGRRLNRERNGLVPNLKDFVVLKGKYSGREKTKSRITTDSFGRRYTGINPDSQKKKNVVFLGCSFTHGLGVHNEETFPYLFQQQTSLNAYNYGVNGSSPSLTLKMLKEMKGEYLQGINQEETAVIYTVIPDHISRIVGTSLHFRFMPEAFFQNPYFSLENDKLIYRHSFSEDPTYGKHFLKWLSRIHFLHVFWVDLPSIKSEHHQLIARVFQEIEKELKSTNPQVKSFHVAFYPLGGVGQRSYLALRDALVQNKISVLDYSMLNSNSLLQPHNTLEYDTHPSPLAYELYSSLLANDLRKFMNP